MISFQFIKFRFFLSQSFKTTIFYLREPVHSHKCTRCTQMPSWSIPPFIWLHYLTELSYNFSHLSMMTKNRSNVKLKNEIQKIYEISHKDKILTLQLAWGNIKLLPPNLFAIWSWCKIYLRKLEPRKMTPDAMWCGWNFK